jgi:major type 1 subunit fimbrin (pilin)
MKYTQSVLLSAVMFCSTLPLVHAADGTINFTGRVVDESCIVDTSTSTGNLTVPLGDVPISVVNVSGGKSPDTPFSIVLTGCPDNDAQISLSFSGPSNTTNASLLAPQAGDSGTVASGVGIAIFDKTSGTASTTPIDVSTSAKSGVVTTDANGNATFNFIANIMNDGSDASNVKAGDANASADITINYQ